MNNKNNAISQLKRLKKPMGKQGEAGLKARIEFFCVAIGSGLKESLVNYDLFDQHNLGERDLCTCFEMHDGDDVVHGIISETKKNPTLERMIKKEYGNDFFKSWLMTFNDIENREKLGVQLSFI
ncbi:hypothetical protein [Thalassotalea piscium]|uniref:Uncharacterized protein n=1 Tax=Thalassotalea piscium TaxID=1230533 RepID=A0A7X0NGM5_9GAMM|nr:hypothetical protein [Thalassotalea piscium]MBB6543099.1 hypothetical protein [Thalassotalea piscium]